MIEAEGNLWHAWVEGSFVVIPTNLRTRADGTAIMGAGLARTAATILPGLDRVYGSALQSGQRVLGTAARVILLPTKDDPHDGSDIHLIATGIRHLVSWLAKQPLDVRVALPRLGCGLGRLRWSDVQPPLASQLDDRCTVMTPVEFALPFHARSTPLLSNFSPHAVPVWMERDAGGLGQGTAPTVEHAYQIAKCDTWADRFRIRDAETPAEARKLGRAVALKPGWDGMRLGVMRRLLRYKYTLHPDAADFLISTERQTLRHLAPWDEFWGTGKEGCGADLLGYLTMETRRHLAETGVTHARAA